MGALRGAVLALVLCLATPAQADEVARWRPYVEEASARFGIPVAWIERVMRAESGGRTMLNGRPIVSPAGAMGLMQLMPATWAAMRARLGLGHDPHHPRDNILAGTLYLRLMYDRFGYPGLFGAYNAGPVRYGAYVASGRALPGETRAYLANVSGTAIPAPTPRPATARGGTIFFAVRPDPDAATRGQDAASDLFVPLRAARESDERAF